jgi:hypothetical protein
MISGRSGAVLARVNSLLAEEGSERWWRSAKLEKPVRINVAIGEFRTPSTDARHGRIGFGRRSRWSTKRNSINLSVQIGWRCGLG